MNDYSQTLKKYRDDILSGNIASCIYTKKAIQRFIKDLNKQKRAEFPFVYKQDCADLLLSFTEELKPSDMNGAKIKLLPWQIFVLSNLKDKTTLATLEEKAQTLRVKMAEYTTE